MLVVTFACFLATDNASVLVQILADFSWVYPMVVGRDTVWPASPRGAGTGA